MLACFCCIEPERILSYWLVLTNQLVWGCFYWDVRLVSDVILTKTLWSAEKKLCLQPDEGHQQLFVHSRCRKHVRIETCFWYINVSPFVSGCLNLFQKYCEKVSTVAADLTNIYKYCLFCQFSWCWMIGWIEIKAAAGWWWWWWRFTDSVSCYECILWSIKQCEHHSSVQLEEKKYLIRKQIDGLNAVRNSSSLSSSSSSSSSSCKQKKKANSKRSHDTKTINSNINMFKILKSISAERVQRSTHSTESKSLYRRIIID